MDPIKEALTYDDVLLTPKYSEILPSETVIKTKLSKNLNLKDKNVIFLSANKESYLKDIFDEENNIIFAELLESAGVQLIFGIQGLKVHSKICVIERSEANSINRIGFISTGNFNESTAI